jgi:RimJ/RimL family protein N-acetyltransferase
VVSAVVEMCLARGYQEIGWQCLRSNKGSIGTARAVGFQKERDYLAFSSFIPAETATDLSSEEYADWAMHYERFLPEHPWTAFEAVQAWAMAGRLERALENLRFLKQTGWKARPEWINRNWRLENLLEIEEAAKLLTEITA